MTKDLFYSKVIFISPSKNLEAETEAHIDIPKHKNIPYVFFREDNIPTIPSTIIGSNPYPKELIIL